MSTTLEQKTGSPSWRKRPREDLESLDQERKELKKPRYYYFRLESESSKASEDDTESICSIQDKDTDVVRDTSDTESQADSEKNGDEYELEIEYEVASLSGSDANGIEVSSSDSDDMMLAAAAAVMCDSSIEAWVTDGEDSDSSSDETSFGRTDFSTCVQCKGENDNPLYRYCEKCFQDRKRFFPPRPRRNRRKNTKAAENPVKLDTLRNCLSGLSQDSGIGSSQECPSLGLDQIVVPDYLHNSGMSNSEEQPISNSKSSVLEKIEETDLESSQPNSIIIGNGKDKRKRQSSESSLSDFEVKKPKIDPKPESSSDLCSEVSSTSSLPTTLTDKSSFSSETSGFVSGQEKSNSTSLEKSSSFGSDKSETELCMFCNNAPKDSIFLHTNIAHRCCCYRCAKKTLKTIKRCPICNRSVNKVVKIFTS